MDIMPACTRSALMSRIRATDTGPELAIRKTLFGLGYRYRLHGKKLAGKPDIVFPGRKRVIFVHGCFWHRHTCGRAHQPKTRPQFWQKKFDANISRDKRNLAELRTLGWKALVIWECEIDDTAKLRRRLLRFLGQPNVKNLVP